MNISQALEDYLEIIFLLSKHEGHVHANDIAKALKVKKPSVTSALKKLSKLGLIHYLPYKPIELTPEGLSRAESISKIHKKLKEFLIKVLAINPTEADNIACTLEHHISIKAMQKFSSFVEFIDNCPYLDYSWVDGKGYYCNTDENGNCLQSNQKCKNRLK